MLGARRAKRMERRLERGRRRMGLSLISLMDIFTILVFFLLVQSSDGEVLPTTKAVRLPESVAEKAPRQTLVVTVNDQDILVQGRKVASVGDVIDSGGELIEPLKAELDHHVRRERTGRGNTRREITIMGDKEIPYRLLKKIMVTCVRAKYENISLAVLRKEQQS